MTSPLDGIVETPASHRLRCVLAEYVRAIQNPDPHSRAPLTLNDMAANVRHTSGRTDPAHALAELIRVLADVASQHAPDITHHAMTRHLSSPAMYDLLATDLPGMLTRTEFEMIFDSLATTSPLSPERASRVPSVARVSYLRRALHGKLALCAINREVGTLALALSVEWAGTLADLLETSDNLTNRPVPLG